MLLYLLIDRFYRIVSLLKKLTNNIDKDNSKLENKKTKNKIEIFNLEYKKYKKLYIEIINKFKDKNT